MRRQILAKMGDPDQTQYYQLQMRDLDTAISLERGDWCHWLIHTQPGYGDLMTSIERRRYGKTYPKYLKLDQMLAKHTANNNQN